MGGMELKIGGQIERVNGKELRYAEFVERYMGKNEPVVVTGLMDDWRACKDWVTSEGKPNLQFFSTHFGKSRVQVADCGTREFTDQKRAEMSVSEFIFQWETGLEEDHSGVSRSNGKSVLYLKDWHFVKEYPEYLAYTTPLLFCDDWLNLYLDYHRMHMDPDTYQETNDISCSDYRFVYMGAKGSWTPLHADVFRSYSWSANVCGKKRWLFLPPSQHQLVFDRNMKNSVYDIFNNVNDSTFPGFKKTIWLECIQEQNEIIFVPSGWFHQVHNLDDTISINHNWFNGYNLSWIWDLLVRDYNEAKEYIEDIRDICDDFEGLCQRNLAINTGMNFHDFFTFITRFAIGNLVLLYNVLNGLGGTTGISPSLASQFALNLTSIQKIALKMDFTGLAKYPNIVDPMETLNDTQFLEFCIALGKKYEMIKKETWNSESCESLADVLGSPDFKMTLLKVQNPEELVKCIDCAVAKLHDANTEESLFPSGSG